MINRKQFSRKFAERYGMAYQNAEQICRNTFELLGHLLYEEQEDIIFSGFGAFKHKKAKAKNVRHPSTGKMLVTSERDFVKFTPSQSLGLKEENIKAKLSVEATEYGKNISRPNSRLSD